MPYPRCGDPPKVQGRNGICQSVNGSPNVCVGKYVSRHGPICQSCRTSLFMEVFFLGARSGNRTRTRWLEATYPGPLDDAYKRVAITGLWFVACHSNLADADIELPRCHVSVCLGILGPLCDAVLLHGIEPWACCLSCNCSTI